MRSDRVAVFVMLVLLCGAASAVSGQSRPNIVFAFADDLGQYASACADPQRPSANDVIRTPHIDRVAGEGALFAHAFVSAPSCTPSRAAIVSCRHFFRNGSHSQLHHPWVRGVPDPWDDVRGFPLLLQDAGYHIGWSWKMHISEDRMGGRQRNYRAAGSRFNQFSQNAMKADDPEAEMKVLLNEVLGNFTDFLNDRDEGQPFYYWFNPTNTHRAWAAGSGQRLWGIDPDDLKGRLPPFLPDVPEVRADFADYLGEAQAFDAAVGVLWNELSRRGELDNTIFIVSGDHGAPGFPRGKCNLYDFGTEVLLAIRWPAGIPAGSRIETPVSLIDLGPTFLDAAGLQPTADMNGQSLLPALRSGDETMLRGWALFGRENHVNEARPGGLPYPMRGIRTADHLFLINFAPDRWPVAEPPLSAPLLSAPASESDSSRRRMDIDFGPTRDYFVLHEDDPAIRREWQLGFGRRPREELYAIGSDPGQTNNLAADPQFREIRQQLHDRLLAELKDGQDPRVTGDGSAFDKPPYALDDPQRGRIRR